ncbi:hypothetical protein NIES2119_24420 [[Phormidium ambiguum] IAM M-71]|uniref:DUF5357 domain-containing protein n=1 Tax=[Phormidium ambiguum] IAM M-71 TaxID=454136 RepID=A0A1U7I953_9CYAN|nr:DUF5357 family protein [Phormidium ambiguum]OKH33044.1 hypothetical protein NIES2119_24420 [Phormidium ambiguum IAM M-71]
MNNFSKAFSPIINLFKPSRFSWQTVIIISIAIWIVAGFFWLNGNLILQNRFAILGSVIVIIGFGWFTFENPLIIRGYSLSTWILVELICLFLASLLPELAPFILMLWPALSAIAAAWPEFIAADKKVKNLTSEKRLKLIIWLLFHLIISCWINFSLIIQDWISQYPSLLADNFSQSDFVIKIQPFSPSITEGEKVVNVMEQYLKNQINFKPWTLAENWLKNPNQQKKMLTQAKEAMIVVKEKDLWKFRTTVTAQKTGYNLSMIAEWLGPSYHPQGYLLKKDCQVSPVTQQPNPNNSNLRRSRRTNTRVMKTTGTGLNKPSPNVNKPTMTTAKPIKVANVQCQSVTKQIIEQNQPKSSPKL